MIIKFQKICSTFGPILSTFIVVYDLKFKSWMDSDIRTLLELVGVWLLIIVSYNHYVKVTQTNQVSRNQLHNTANGCQTFEFERQNIAGWCNVSLWVQYKTEPKQNMFFFSFLSALLNWCKNSNFFKLKYGFFKKLLL